MTDAKDVAAPHLRYSAFVVNDSPRCMWSDSRQARNTEFLEGIDPGYFKYVAALFEREIEGENKTFSLLALRLAYGQALETLFALLGAAIQAPHCPLGWIMSYKAGELHAFVRNVSTGKGVLAADSVPGSWADVSRSIHVFDPTPPKRVEDVQQEFGAIWARLAHDFSDESASDEYNSLKHGFRARHGGFDLTIGQHEDAGPAPLESKSEFGTRSFALKWLDTSKVNFCVLDAWRNWDPTSLVVRLELIAASIVNVRSYLLRRQNAGTPNIRFEWMADPRQIARAWKSEFLIASLRGGFVLDPEDIEPITKEKILSLYKASRER